MIKKSLKIFIVAIGILLILLVVASFAMLNISIGIDNPERGPKQIPEGISGGPGGYHGDHSDRYQYVCAAAGCGS